MFVLIKKHTPTAFGPIRGVDMSARFHPSFLLNSICNCMQAEWYLAAIRQGSCSEPLRERSSLCCAASAKLVSTDRSDNRTDFLGFGTKIVGGSGVVDLSPIQVSSVKCRNNNLRGGDVGRNGDVIQIALTQKL